ncbi:hypothetical protein CkaCkLH20_03104 [Colletotrichum karsti]|uniref:Uncharacterized protein n=1 Tax=Colletotrichum karsti TaxID=1095194 RepID=A0A9P6IFF9_9PEZI|nr:uncharacterized protein CkaCkLH20_03104 [Colletotrichum karsti]KAF9879561.1 hypothetical protein CkaCkLH20_03104 [Colletotrichum karsti]
MVFPVLPKTPIPSLSLSAAGLVALADLQTIAHRTALTGTSSWFDGLVLAPGLHYQQAADGVVAGEAAASAETSKAFDGGNAGGGGGLFGTEALPGGGVKNVRITNPGMLLFLSRLGVEDRRAREREMRKSKGAGGIEAQGKGSRVIVLDVGAVAARKRRTRRGRAFEHDGEWEFERGSHLLYLASPLLTLAALTVMVLLGDWWGLAAITALITSRLLNIYIIKQRTPTPPPPSPPSTSSSKMSEYTIPLSGALTVRMRGPAADLAALTTETWLLSKTAAQGYLEAVAKLAVYMVAVFSGNVSQAGNMVLLVLLLGSAGLLGLSNGFMKGVKGSGRVARVWDETKMAAGSGRGGEGGGGQQLRRRREFDAFVQGQQRPAVQSRRETEDGNGGEWGSQAGTVVRDSYPFEGSVDYT